MTDNFRTLQHSFEAANGDYVRDEKRESRATILSSFFNGGAKRVDVEWDSGALESWWIEGA